MSSNNSIYQKYRNYINDRKELLNIAGICRQVGIQRQALHIFLRGYDNALSLEKLNQVIDVIKNIS